MSLTEIDYIPQTASPLFPGPWLVLAPHPDDETYGMGGTIAMGRATGLDVEILVATDGALGGAAEDDLVVVREHEAAAAVAALGGASLHFWRVGDRQLVPDANLIAALTERLDARAGGTLFFPSPVEPHPDHRALAVIAWEASRRRGFPMLPVSYEISVQGPCNRLIDITPGVEHKQRAMAVYQSQEAERAYASFILALNRTRAWSLPANVELAEAFCVFPTADVPLAEALAGLRRYQAEGLSYTS